MEASRMKARPHIRGCKRRTALECPVGWPCFCPDPVLVCDVCDPCTCGAETTSEEWGAILREGLKLWIPIVAFMFVAILGWFLVKKLPHDRHSDRSRISSKKIDR